MYHKLRNTLTGLAISAFVLGVSYSTGQSSQATTVTDMSFGVATSAELCRAELLRKERRQDSRRHNLVMPYFSFGALLPRKGL